MRVEDYSPCYLPLRYYEGERPVPVCMIPKEANLQAGDYLSVHENWKQKEDGTQTFEVKMYRVIIKDVDYDPYHGKIGYRYTVIPLEGDEQIKYDEMLFGVKWPETQEEWDEFKKRFKLKTTID